jgi:Tfp pilus assembly protein PilF
MNKVLTIALLFLATTVFAQKKPSSNQQPGMAEMEKMMKAQGMSDADIKAMKEMIGPQPGAAKGVPAANNVAATPTLANMVGSYNASKIAAIKPGYNPAQLNTTVTSLQTKLLAKGNAAQIAEAKKILLLAKKPTDLLDAAHIAMQEGKMHTALLIMLNAAKLFPDNLLIQNNLAAMLTQAGYPEQAIPILKKLEASEEAGSVVYNNLAFAYLQLGDTKAAYQNAAKALATNPNHPQAPIAAAAALQKEGKTEEAKKMLQQAANAQQTKLADELNQQNGNPNVMPTLTWAEVKSKLSIYEFAPKGWRQTLIPKTTGDISYSKQFYADFGSDQNMRTKLSKLLNELAKRKEKEQDELVKDMSSVLKMAKQSVGMVELSVIASKVQHAIIAAWNKEKAEKWDKLFEEQSKKKGEVIGRKGGFSSAGSCPDQKPINDAEHAKRMKEINSTLLPLVQAYEEDERIFTNAMMTWLLISGTPATMPGVEAGAYSLLEDYACHNDELSLYWKYHYPTPQACGGGKESSVPEYNIPLLEIPKLDCPIIFSIPSGFGSLSTGSVPFSISQATLNSLLYGSTSFGTSNSKLSDAGAGNNPHINNSGATSQIASGSSGSTAEEELHPLVWSDPNMKRFFEDEDYLAPLAKTAAQRRAEQAAARKATKEIINASSAKNCNAQLTNSEKRKKKIDELQKDIDRYIDEQERVELERIKEKNKSKLTDDEELSPLYNKKKQKVDDEELASLAPLNETGIKKFYNEVKSAVQEAVNNGGLSPTINNGPTIVGKINGFISGLFN